MISRQRGSVILLVVVSASCCTQWHPVVSQPGQGRPIVNVDADGQPCFDVMIYGTDEETQRIRGVLSEVCQSLRDPAMRKYLADHQYLVDETDRLAVASPGWSTYLDPNMVGAGRSEGRDRVSFHVFADSIGSPGRSEICVKKDPATRALAIDRGDRLNGKWDESDQSELVNTIAHELMHLHSHPKYACSYQFTDGGKYATKCRRVSYAVGNAAGCSYLARHRTPGTKEWTDKDWQTCMRKQAENTPGRQKTPMSSRDALGCDKP